MTTQKINPIKAASIKKFMKISGINVLRCTQNGLGVLVTVSDENGNIENATKFFLDYGLVRKGRLSMPSVISKGKGYADFGTLFSITSE